MTDADRLAQLRRLGEALRTAFEDERRAIARLDHAQILTLAAHKTQLAAELTELRPHVTPTQELRDLFAAVRVEARATAMLAAVAADAVRNLLGYEPTGYDRRARRTATTPARILTTY